jgi:predicted Zn-dependent protease
MMTNASLPLARVVRRLLGRAVAVLAAAVMAVPPLPAVAQEKQTLIRDAEIEQLLREYTGPIFKAAGIPTGKVKVTLISDRAYNAFVADGRRIFINVGALMDAGTPNEIIGVLAHESGHIAGGHLARLHEQLANAQLLAIAGMLVGAGAIVGAANSGNRVGNPGAGAAGVITGSQELARRNLLSYQRGEEQAADRAAVRFLSATQQSVDGLLATFHRFADASLFSSKAVDPYLLSHPLPQERIANLETLAAASPYKNVKDPPTLQARHDLMRAKLYGFVERQETVMRRYPASDQSLPARYARAVVAYRNGRKAEALSLTDSLIAQQPGNAYFWEFKGQVLLESGRATESLAPLRKAVALAPNAGLIRMLLGHALVATDNPAYTDEAVRELLNAVEREPEAPEAYRDLATAQARKGNIAMAELNSALFFFNTGQFNEAATQASRAMAKLPQGSPGWIRAEDIVNYRPLKADKPDKP